MVDERVTRAFEAVKSHDADALKVLLREDPLLAGLRNGDEVSLLLYSRYQGASECGKVLEKSRHEMDPFESAAFDEKRRVAKFVKKDPTLVRARTKDGWTLLHLACYFGGPGTAEVLLEAGADQNAVAENGTKVQPLHSAVARRNLELTKLLLAHGADVNGRQAGGWTPLHSAAYHGASDLVELLLRQGADPALTSDDGRTASDMARAAGHEQLARRTAV